MNWTREKPTAAGWYWFREAPTKEPHVVKVWGEHGFMRVLEMWRELSEALDDFDGEFKGPITPDSYQQGRVEGLREAAIICRERGKPHDIEWWMTASKKEVSAQTAIDCAELIEQLAQQAQEGGVGDGHS